MGKPHFSKFVVVILLISLVAAGVKVLAFLTWIKVYFAISFL